MKYFQSLLEQISLTLVESISLDILGELELFVDDLQLLEFIKLLLN